MYVKITDEDGKPIDESNPLPVTIVSEEDEGEE